MTLDDIYFSINRSVNQSVEEYARPVEVGMWMKIDNSMSFSVRKSINDSLWSTVFGTVNNSAMRSIENKIKI